PLLEVSGRLVVVSFVGGGNYRAVSRALKQEIKRCPTVWLRRPGPEIIEPTARPVARLLGIAPQCNASIPFSACAQYPGQPRGRPLPVVRTLLPSAATHTRS